jgi:FkbM family methyltransferase
VQRVARVAEHSFLEAPLRRRGAVVVDLGCNRGGFASGMIERYGATVYAVEPVPELFAALPRLPGLHVEQLAIVGDATGEVELLINEGSCATIDRRLGEAGATAVAVPAERLDQLLSRHGLTHVDVLKVDIEGAEIEMLDGTSDAVLATIAQISVEYHDFADPSLAPQVAATHSRLVGLGFWSLAFSRGNQDVLYVNSAKLPVSPAERLWITSRYRNLRGLRRMLDRWRGRVEST